MTRINVKPLSVNEAFQGKRYKTNVYNSFEQEALWKLPNHLKIPKEGNLEVTYTFGLSSKLADYDNPIKTFQDVLQKKYDFDDKRIYRACIEKVDVEKGHEFISFVIKSLNTNNKNKMTKKKRFPSNIIGKMVFTYVKDFVSKNGYAPSLTEIGKNFDISATHAGRILKFLEDEGAIKKTGRRMVKIIKDFE